jgi:hypothetical protein
MTISEETPPQAPTSRDAANWAKPVDRLSAAGVTGAAVDAVTGRRVAGPLQGFGQLWQKTFRVPLEGSSLSPQEVIAIWKDQFPTFWPKTGRFYAPLAGIVPGEVALLDIEPVPGSPIKFSTGVLVLYADDDSFTFINPEGHALSAWITFSAYRDGDTTIAQAQALERTSDPFDELGYMLGGNRMNDRFWRDTLTNVGRAMGVTEPAVDVVVVCIDPRRQWRHVANLRNSITLRAARRTLTAPYRWITGQR